MERWTESLVFERLAGPFPPPAYVLLPQVRNGTGYRRRKDRTADALGVSVWPSRGLYFVGFEIKVSRSDWRKELGDPAKSVSIQRFCRHWYIAAPKGVVPVAELPENWGLVECTAKSASIVKQAPTLEPEPPDMLFVASVLRKAAEATVPVDQVRAQINEAAEAIAERKVFRVEHDLSELREAVSRFEAASGVKLGTEWSCGEIGEAVAFVREHGAGRLASHVQSVRQQAERVVQIMDHSLAKLRGEEEGEK